MLALTATLFVVWYTNDNPGATVVGWTWTVAETALALVMAAILMRFFIAQVAAAWVGVTTTLQELEVQQIELTQARQLLREVGDVARNTATVQREAMGLAREQARLGEDTLRLRREVQDGQTQLRAERENVRSIEESPGVKAAHRYIPSVPSTPWDVQHRQRPLLRVSRKGHLQAWKELSLFARNWRRCEFHSRWDFWRRIHWSTEAREIQPVVHDPLCDIVFRRYY